MKEVRKVDTLPPVPDPAVRVVHVALAAGVGHEGHVVLRAADDTDEDYEARRRVFALALSVARQI